MKRNILICLSFVLLFGASLFSNEQTTLAYADYSKYKLEINGFAGESVVSKNLTQLKNDTGWSATYEKTGEGSYQIYSGGFGSKEYTEQILNQFVTATGIKGSYEPTGDSTPYYKVYSGGFGTKSKASTVAADFEKSTGFKGIVEPVGEKTTQFYQVYSGGFGSESYTRDILSRFQKETGLSGSYEPVGNGTAFYQIRSGGFSTENRAQTIAADFQKATGIKASVEAIGNASLSYKIQTGGFVGLKRVETIIQQIKEQTGQTAKYEQITGSDSLRIIIEDMNQEQYNRVRSFMDSQKWWYTTSSKKIYSSFRVVSAPVKGTSLAKKGVSYFENNSWWATYSSTGEIAYNSYRIVSDPVKGTTLAKKGLDFFKKNNWWATYSPTGESTYSSYRVVSEPILGLASAKKGFAYFEKNNWWASYTLTGDKEYSSYRIVSEPIAGTNLLNKGLDYFEKNNWWVTYKTASEDTFKIVTASFTGIDVATAAVERVKSLYDWDAKIIKTYNGPQLMYTDYNITLNSMLDKQMAMNPQTDKYRNEPRYVHADFVNLSTQRITADKVNLRSSPSTADSSNIVQQLNTGDQVMIIGKTGDWVEVRLTWQNAKTSDVNYYLNPNNFSIDNKDYFQFLKLSKSANLNVSEVNDKILSGKGILAGKGQAFIEAANKYNINELYLISHSLLETGNGTSKLATGVVYNGRTVYNMYGYGAYDSCALECGAKKAYELGWFTPEAAIIGGAQFISSGYIYNTTFQQDTLYKMRWNPVQTWHQYATDIGWAYKQVSSIHNLYLLLDNYTLYYDVPVYK